MKIFVVILFLGLATSFFVYLIVRNLIPSKKTQAIVTIIGTIVITPLAYYGLLALIFAKLLHEPAKPFENSSWHSNKSQRHQMADDLLESGLLINKSKSEILTIIGHPDYGVDSSRYWVYDLGISSAGLGWKFTSLAITFRNDSAIKVDKREILD